MMEKGLRYHSCIKECQWTAVPVPFLEWGDPFCWNSSSKTFVVFCDTGMLLFMIVFIQIDCPETVQLFQCPDIFKFWLTDEVIHHLMELFNLALAFPWTWFGMHDTDSKSRKWEPDLLCDVLTSIIKVAGIKGAISGNGLMEGVLNDGFFLIIVKPGGKQISGMVINGRG